MSYFNGITDDELREEGWTEEQIADLRRIEKLRLTRASEKNLAISAARANYNPFPEPKPIRNKQRQKTWFAFWPVTIKGETRWMRFVTVLQESSTRYTSLANPGWPPGANGYYTATQNVWENIAFL